MTPEPIPGSRLLGRGGNTAFSGLRSGEIARRAGVSADTLRHYERRGLLPKPRRLANGYRAYPPEALDRVILIQRALGVGFTLDELAELLRDRDRGRPPCRKVRELAGRKLRDVERQIADLSEFREDLLRTLRDWDDRLASTDVKSPARLLESLASNPEARSSPMRAVDVRPSPKTKGPIVKKTVPALLIAAASLAGSAARAQDCHHAKVAERGDHVMGFDHAKTTHHFLLSPAGGSIEVSANDPADTESRDAIRGHLEHIASMFSEGNFDAPMLIHDRVPPGRSRR